MPGRAPGGHHADGRETAPDVRGIRAHRLPGSTVPASNAQAQALVSQIQGIATGKTAAASALQAAGITRNVNAFVTSHVSVAGLGGSQVVDLTVTDGSPRVAATVAKDLAQEVVQLINRTGQSGLSTTLNAIDQEIVRLSEQHGAAGRRRPRPTPRTSSCSQSWPDSTR